jgi:chromosome segregation ATPase
MNLHDAVVITATGQTGKLRFLGSTSFRPGIWAGIELDERGTGKNDGTVRGVEYFICPPATGLFVPADKIQILSDNDTPNTSPRKRLLSQHSSALTPPTPVLRFRSKSPTNYLRTTTPVQNRMRASTFSGRHSPSPVSSIPTQQTPSRPSRRLTLSKSPEAFPSLQQAFSSPMSRPTSQDLTNIEWRIDNSAFSESAEQVREISDLKIRLETLERENRFLTLQLEHAQAAAEMKSIVQPELKELNQTQLDMIEVLEVKIDRMTQQHENEIVSQRKIHQDAILCLENIINDLKLIVSEKSSALDELTTKKNLLEKDLAAQRELAQDVQEISHSLTQLETEVARKQDELHRLQKLCFVTQSKLSAKEQENERLLLQQQELIEKTIAGPFTQCQGISLVNDQLQGRISSFREIAEFIKDLASKLKHFIPKCEHPIVSDYLELAPFLLHYTSALDTQLTQFETLLISMNSIEPSHDALTHISSQLKSSENRVQELQRREMDNVGVDHELSRLSALVRDLEGRLECMNEELATSRTALAITEKAKNSAEKERDSQISLSKSDQSQIKLLTDQLQSQAMTLIQMEERYSDLLKSSSDAASLQSQVAHLEHSLVVVRNQLADRDMKINEMISAVATSESSEHQIRNQLKSAEVRLELLQSEFKSMEENLKAKSDEVEELQTKLNTLKLARRETIARYSESIDMLMVDMTKLQSKYDMVTKRSTINIPIDQDSSLAKVALRRSSSLTMTKATVEGEDELPAWLVSHRAESAPQIDSVIALAMEHKTGSSTSTTETDD